MNITRCVITFTLHKKNATINPSFCFWRRPHKIIPGYAMNHHQVLLTTSKNDILWRKCSHSDHDKIQEKSLFALVYILKLIQFKHESHDMLYCRVLLRRLDSHWQTNGQHLTWTSQSRWSCLQKHQWVFVFHIKFI